MRLPPIVLASGSPRRLALLRQIGISPRVIEPTSAEVDDGRPDSADLAESLARQKAGSVLSLLQPNELAVAADTIVVLDQRRFGKPKNAEDARGMLAELSGKWHTVITGVCLLGPAFSIRSANQSTRVRMAKLSAREIEAYLRSGECQDKAGAYALQGLGSLFIEEISGDPTNVVGLPLYLTARLLANACAESDIEFLLDTKLSGERS